MSIKYGALLDRNSAARTACMTTATGSDVADIEYDHGRTASVEADAGGRGLDRDRALAGLTRRVMVGWALLWSAIIAFLFLFGETLAIIVV